MGVKNFGDEEWPSRNGGSPDDDDGGGHQEVGGQLFKLWHGTYYIGLYYTGLGREY